MVFFTMIGGYTLSATTKLGAGEDIMGKDFIIWRYFDISQKSAKKSDFFYLLLIEGERRTGKRKAAM